MSRHGPALLEAHKVDSVPSKTVTVGEQMLFQHQSRFIKLIPNGKTGGANARESSLTNARVRIFRTRFEFSDGAPSPLL
jgi:hypothetical protein